MWNLASVILWTRERRYHFSPPTSHCLIVFLFGIMRQSINSYNYCLEISIFFFAHCSYILNVHILYKAHQMPLESVPLFMSGSLNIGSSIFWITGCKHLLIPHYVFKMPPLLAFSPPLQGGHESPLLHIIKTNVKYLMSKPAVSSCSLWLLHYAWFLTVQRQAKEGRGGGGEETLSSSINEFQH